MEEIMGSFSDEAGEGVPKKASEEINSNEVSDLLKRDDLDLVPVPELDQRQVAHHEPRQDVALERMQTELDVSVQNSKVNKHCSYTLTLDITLIMAYVEGV